MKIRRLYQTFRLWTIRGDTARANWARKQGIYGAIGDHVAIMDRKVPLYANLIRFHNNIQLASNVHLITHDVIHTIFNRMHIYTGGYSFQEHVGCIEIMDNVFVGSGTTILGNVRIGPNAIVAAGSLVNKDVQPNSIVGGVPAKVIGKFSDLFDERKYEEYPRELRPTNQEVNSKLVELLWKEFIESRELYKDEHNRDDNRGGQVVI